MKKIKTNTSEPDAVNLTTTSNQQEPNKSLRYPDEDLQEFKKIILNKLQEANDHYAFLKETLSGINDHGTDDTSPTFKLLEDTPDFTSKEETALHAIRLQKFIEQLQNALIRIENKTYGVCTVSGQLIPKERLKSVPHTTKSVNAKINESKPN
jgi:RNA polymerase-binding transcription factor DksA